MELLSVLLQIHLLLGNGKGVMILYFPGLFTPCPKILEGVLSIMSLLVRFGVNLKRGMERLMVLGCLNLEKS